MTPRQTVRMSTVLRCMGWEYYTLDVYRKRHDDGRMTVARSLSDGGVLTGFGVFFVCDNNHGRQSDGDQFIEVPPDAGPGRAAVMLNRFDKSMRALREL